ncbi:MAG: polysaccharide biosynthesis/export family protein [Nitrospiraceae bacterium]|nr:MAG: polysaccharide biosynthesis/export family protein [Nitrospiraceae bacterium]
MIVLFSCATNNRTKSVALIVPSDKTSAEINRSELINNDTDNEPDFSDTSLTDDSLSVSSLAEDEDSFITPESETTSAYKGDYILGPGDLIAIDVFQVDELKGTSRISTTGYIKLPLTGKIKIGGLTVAEAESAISEKLLRYLQDPIVNVFVQEYRSQNVTVLGAVSNPQVYTVTRQNFLLDILSVAGGLTGEAGDICYIQRKGETIIVNIRDLLIGGQVRLNIPIFAGDVVHVPAGGVFFVNGSVKSPGSFVMKGTTTLSQAISMAKGFDFNAKQNQIRIYRDSGKATMDIIEIDYKTILEEQSKDVVLQDKDIVIVPKDGVKNFFGGFINSVRGIARVGAVSVSGGTAF